MLEFLPNINSGTLRTLRVLRVLRPLRSFNAIPSTYIFQYFNFIFLGIRKLVEAFFQALPEFVHVAVFLIFVFILFAVLGIHQYNGIFYNKCRTHPFPETPVTWDFDTNITKVCSESMMGNFLCPDQMTCGNPQDYGIPLAKDGVYNDSAINYGISGFDNLGQSLLTVFQIITMQGWSKIMLNLMDADLAFIGSLYCIIIVVIGSFFLMNLILAVI